MSVELKLDPEQEKCTKDVLKHKTLCISPDCGFGKTIVGLVAHVQILKKDPDALMLVVCTPNGIASTWTGEHLKFTQLAHLKVNMLTGTPKQRLTKLNQPSQIVGVSYNNLQWLADNITKDMMKRLKFVYADEGSCLKGETSVWRGLLKLIAACADYKVVSSATPHTKDAKDYFGLTDFLDGGKALGVKNVTEFRAQYCTSYSASNKRVEYKVSKTKALEIEDKVKHLFFSYQSAKHVDIPVKTITVEGRLSETSQAIYDQLQKEQCINAVVRNEHGQILDDLSLTADQVGAKLQQLSSGFIYSDGYCRIDVEQLKQMANVKQFLMNRKKDVTAYNVFDDRVMLFKSLIDKIKLKHGDMPVFIPYYYKHELVQLQSMLPTGVQYKNEEQQIAWNNKEIPYLFGQYSACSMSLNLQHGGNILAFYSPTFKWADDYQIVKRLARQGQPEKLVYAYRLYIRGTYDDIKERTLSERGISHARFQNKIRR